MTSTKSTSAVVLGITAVALTLSACAPNSSTGTAASSGSAPATSASASTAATPTGSATDSSAPATDSTTSAGPSGSVSSSSAPSAPTSAAPSPKAPASKPKTPGPTAGPSGPAAEGLPLCTAARLSGTAAALPGGAAAGSVYAGLTVRNTSGDACRLAGYPGVSFVGGGTGEQIGVPAQRDTTQATVTITLNPGQSARARLQITRAENYGGVCNLKPADGFRVYPPSATDALFLPYTANGCGNPKIVLLHVGAFQPLS